jgi:hypothetical protein
VKPVGLVAICTFKIVCGLYWIQLNRLRSTHHERNLFYFSGDIASVTLLEVVYRYGRPPRQSEQRALDNVREVYGIRRISFNEKERTLRVEFDASRLTEPMVAGLLRGAGVDVHKKLAFA